MAQFRTPHTKMSVSSLKRDPTMVTTAKMMMGMAAPPQMQADREAASAALLWFADDRNGFKTLLILRIADVIFLGFRGISQK
jgi:hypothetical protein